MDNNSDIADKFEEIFKQQNSRRPAKLYSSCKNNLSSCFQSKIDYDPKDIVRNISAQIKAIQNADCVAKSKGVNKVLEKHKTSTFLPVNMLQTPEVPHKKSAKFETQFELDTQLMNVIEDVEAMSSHKGITQEFETSFDNSNIDDVNNRLKLPDNSNGGSPRNKDSQNPIKAKNLVESIEKNLNQEKDLKDHELSGNKILMDDNCTALLDQCMEIEENMNVQDLISDTDINPSPIININTGNKSKSISPLVFNLDSFEKFEKLVVPMIEVNNDIDTVKHLINSQILGKELFLHTDFEPESEILEERCSPVLKISKASKLSPEKHDSAKQSASNINSFEKDVDDFNNASIKDSICEKEITQINILSNAKKKIFNEQEMNSANLEDEILFSSDEEPDVKQTELNDLPFTCALETSFYEHSDVLDTTMYVGFQTASNKSIQVSTVSFTKAKSILDDETDGIRVPTLKDLVDKCDMNPKSVHSNDDDFTNNCSTDDHTKKSEDINLDFDIVMADNTKFVGFKTANGKTIDIVDKNMDKAKSLFKDIDRNEPSKNLSQCSSKFNGFKTASNKNIHLSEKALTSCKRVFQDIDLDINFSGETLLSKIEPCNKKIRHSIQNDESTNNSGIEKQICDTDIPKIDEDILQEFECEIPFNDSTEVKRENNFLGFKTASNKNIEISDNVLQKSKKFFDDIDLQDVLENDYVTSDSSRKEHTLNSKHTNVGFKTASNKIISISDQALARTRYIFQDINIANVETTNNCAEKKITKNEGMNSNTNQSIGFVGFKTASNKEIKISEDALVKTKNIFQDIENPLQNNDITMNADNIDINKHQMSKECFVGFKSPNNNIEISAAYMEKPKNKLQDLNDLLTLNTKEEHCVNFEKNNTEYVFKTQKHDRCDNVCVGFLTASNKPVKISEDALINSNIVFQDILNDKDVLKGRLEETRPGRNTITYVSHDALEKSKNNLEGLEKIEDKRAFHGFQTASNKTVNISAEALAKSRQICGDLYKVNVDSEKDEINHKNTFCKGFQTASNKEVKISTEALARSRKLFADLETDMENDINILDKGKSDFKCNDKKDKDTCFVGFQTASHKEVKISAAALEKCKNVFKDIDVIDENDFEVDIPKPAFSFQTASNKAVKVSSEALTKSKKLYEQLQQEENDVTLNVKPFSHENVEDDEISTGFRGFQTAGNKKVKISVEALAKSRKIFQDLTGCKENELDLPNSKQLNNFKGFNTASNKNIVVSDEAINKGRQILSELKINEPRSDISKPAFSFKTANNNNIEISEEALLKSRQLFTEINHDDDKIPSSCIISKVNANTNAKETKVDYNIDRLIDTQVIKNFDESLNTEDFRSPENKSKRSGSPILSCPKAKKRKFATPYRKDNLLQTPKTIIKEIAVNDDNYKKNKIYTLKYLEKLESNNPEPAITTDLVLDDIEIANFEFTGERNDITDSKLSIDVLKVHFLKSVNKKLVPDGWYENHINLILWKLLSYEIRFPKTMQGVCTAKNVMAQLKYRYFKELYNAERPALRKILERDDIASKTLVLCVRDVYVDLDEKSSTNQTELLLTDGWYSIRTCIDKMLLKYVNEGRIKIGTKLIINGAELLNCEQGVAPWEDTSSVRLKIFGNSTRRARWDARLGYHGNAAILSHLSSVTPEGGKVAKLRVVVARVYPALYVEKFEDGSTVTRSERLEHIHQMKYEADRQALVEKIYEEVEKEMSDEESPDSEDLDIGKRSLDSGSQIARMLKMSKEPSQLRANLTDSQRRLLESYTSLKRDKILQNIQDRVRSKLSTVMRNVVPLLKIRVAEVEGDKIHKALLSIWKPNDALSELITEGATIEILNVVPTAIRFSELQLSAGRQTIFKQMKPKPRDIIQPNIKSIYRTCYPIKEIVTHPSMITDYNEIDTIGIVIQIDPSHKEFKSINQFQNVYLADGEKNIICVNFWGGIKKFGFENVLDTGQVVACVNLQKRAGNTRKNIPQYRATEFTYFTKTPKSVDARKFIDELLKNVCKNKGFVDECLAVKNNLLKSNICNENISPYRFLNHDLTKNKVYIESPLARVQKDEFNLSGLDFESTFRQTEPQDLSPKSLLRKKRFNERISKLKMYGEPPPLSPINIINKSENATKSFKSPLLNSSVASKTPVTSVKNLPENMGENDLNCSPVLSVHRTLKKCVNPVKLNFNDVAIDENDSVDHFAEEFDASPPLSLD